MAAKRAARDSILQSRRPVPEAESGAMPITQPVANAMISAQLRSLLMTRPPGPAIASPENKLAFSRDTSSTKRGGAPARTRSVEIMDVLDK